MPMSRPPTSDKAAGAFDRVAEDLEDSGVRRGSMFGMPCLMAGQKALAGLWGDALVVKLTADAHDQALALQGAEPFDPAGMSRPMTEWVVVPLAHARRWNALAHAARDYVA